MAIVYYACNENTGTCAFHPHIQLRKKCKLGGWTDLLKSCPCCEGAPTPATGNKLKIVYYACDEHSGMCAFHPDVQLRKKSAFGGWTDLLKSCPKCMSVAVSVKVRQTNMSASEFIEKKGGRRGSLSNNNAVDSSRTLSTVDSSGVDMSHRSGAFDRSQRSGVDFVGKSHRSGVDRSHRSFVDRSQRNGVDGISQRNGYHPRPSRRQTVDTGPRKIEYDSLAAGVMPPRRRSDDDSFSFSPIQPPQRGNKAMQLSRAQSMKAVGSSGSKVPSDLRRPYMSSAKCTNIRQSRHEVMPIEEKRSVGSSTGSGRKVSPQRRGSDPPEEKLNVSFSNLQV